MVAIPKQVEYALMALSEMSAAAPGEVFAVRGLCDRHAAPFDVMSRSLQRLQRAGVVRAVRGVQGGYQLIRPAADVSVLELYEALTGPLKSVRCLEHPGRCPLSAHCVVVGSMQLLDDRLRALYRGITVAELLDSRRRPRRPTAPKPARRPRARTNPPEVPHA